jgi:hypothetical protein
LGTNIMSLLRNWYLIQTGAVDPAPKIKKFDDKLMEINPICFFSWSGHFVKLVTMGASSATVENWRDKNSKLNGHTSSIMDYAF